jgi:pyridoxine 4-dehydrogenase
LRSFFQVRIATKLAPYPWRIGKGSYLSAAQESLRRLGRDTIDVAQLHWAPPLGWQETAYWEALAELYTTKRARAVGLSNYGPKQLAKAHAGLKKFGAPLASNQASTCFSCPSRRRSDCSLHDQHAHHHGST